MNKLTIFVAASYPTNATTFTTLAMVFFLIRHNGQCLCAHMHVHAVGSEIFEQWSYRLNWELSTCTRTVFYVDGSFSTDDPAFFEGKNSCKEPPPD